MAALVSPAELCAVVKADAYGHGALDAARAFLEGGARSLAVALVEEGIELRRAGIEAPVLLLSEPVAGGMEEAVIHRLTPTVYTPGGVDALLRALSQLGAGTQATGVHVKVDTGMHRVGASPEEALPLVRRIAESGQLELTGLWTHLAVADCPDDPYTARQLSVFEKVLSECRRDGQPGLTVHAANSAGATAFPQARYSMVRCGLALYGYLPAHCCAVTVEPVMSVKARVSYVKELAAGERLSYGLAYEVPHTTTIATVPIGYADGVPRRFGTSGGQVLVGGRRSQVAGNVTMDQLMVDCGPGSQVQVGDEVVLLGRQGDESISADEWASWLGVIPYEVLCGIGPRVPRVCV